MPNSSHPKRPTIRDVARLAGVSRTTVSFILNDVASANISSETRERVRAVIADLNYHPNEAARAMGRRASFVIGVANPDPYNPYYQEMIDAIESSAAQEGYTILVAATRYDVRLEIRCFDWLRQKRIDGLIFFPSSGAAVYADLPALVAQHYPLVVIGSELPGIDAVCIDAGQIDRQILQHLTGLGHRKIGFINAVPNQETFSMRLNACLASQVDFGLPIRDEWIYRCGATFEDGYQATARFLAETRPPERPTALIVMNDMVSAAVIARLRQDDLRVPEDISIVSFDNTRQALFTVSPRLTTCDDQTTRVGEMASRLLIARIQDPLKPVEILRTQQELVVRESTAPPPSLE